MKAETQSSVGVGGSLKRKEASSRQGLGRSRRVCDSEGLTLAGASRGDKDWITSLDFPPTSSPQNHVHSPPPLTQTDTHGDTDTDLALPV